MMKSNLFPFIRTACQELIATSRCKSFHTYLLTAFLMLSSVGVLGQYTGVGTFTKITSLSELDDGYYIIANSTDAFAMNNENAASYFGKTNISPALNTISDPSVDIVWKISTNGTGWSIYNESTSKYVSYTGSSNTAQAVDAVTTNNQRWNFTYSSGFLMSRI